MVGTTGNRRADSYTEHGNVHVEPFPFFDAHCMLTAYKTFGDYRNF
jgi:hypothetical protein